MESSSFSSFSFFFQHLNFQDLNPKSYKSMKSEMSRWDLKVMKNFREVKYFSGFSLNFRLNRVIWRTFRINSQINRLFFSSISRRLQPGKKGPTLFPVAAEMLRAVGQTLQFLHQRRLLLIQLEQDTEIIHQTDLPDFIPGHRIQTPENLLLTPQLPLPITPYKSPPSPIALTSILRNSRVRSECEMVLL